MNERLYSNMPLLCPLCMTEYGDVQELKQHFQTHEVRCSVLVHGSCELDTALKIKCREEEKEERGTKGKGKNTNALWHSPSITSYASQVGLVAQVGSSKGIQEHRAPCVPIDARSTVWLSSNVRPSISLLHSPRPR